MSISQPKTMTRKFILAAMLCGIALALSLVDSALSALIPVLPGFKLGLANVVSLYALYQLGGGYTVLICVVRSLLVAMFSGNMTMLLFSLGGGLASILVMFLLLRRISVVKVSITGGAVHNAVQVLVAVLVTATPEVTLYLPFLVAAGAVSGLLMGILCSILLTRLRPAPMNNREASSV